MKLKHKEDKARTQKWAIGQNSCSKEAEKMLTSFYKRIKQKMYEVIQTTPMGIMNEETTIISHF